MSDSILRDIKRSFLLINIIYILFFLLGFFLVTILRRYLMMVTFLILKIFR